MTVTVTAQDKKFVRLTPTQAKRLKELAEVNAQIAALDKRKKALTADLKAVVGNHDGAVFHGQQVIAMDSRAGSRTCDFKSLEAAFPEAYKRFVTFGAPTRVFRTLI